MANLLEQASSIVRKRIQDALGGIGDAIQQPFRDSYTTYKNPAGQPVRKYNPSIQNRVYQALEPMQKSVESGGGFIPKIPNINTGNNNLNTAFNIARYVPNMAIGGINAISGEPIRNIADIRDAGYVNNGQANSFTPKSGVGKFVNNVQSGNKNPLDYGQNILQTASPFLATYGMTRALPETIGYSLMNGGFNALGQAWNDKGITGKTLDAFGNGLNENVDKAPIMGGFMKATNPYIDKLVTKLPLNSNRVMELASQGLINNKQADKLLLKLTSTGLKSGLNVLQGIGADTSAGNPITKEGMLLDALFPVAGDILGAKFKQGFKDGRYTINWGKDGQVIVRMNGQFSKLLGTEDFTKLKNIGAEFVKDSNGTLKEIKFNKESFQKGAINFGEIADAVKGKQIDPNEALKQEAMKYGSAEEFIKSQETKSPDYAIGGGSGHTAPLRDNENAPAFDLTKLYPKDVYEKGVQYYGSGYEDLDTEALAILKKIKDNPNAEVTIYRAVPKGEGIKDFNKGDWVTLTKGYAKEHGESNLGGKYEILSKKVKADELFTDANSLQEFGYDPRGLSKAQLTDIYNQAKLDPTKPIGEVPTQGLKNNQLVDQTLNTKQSLQNQPVNQLESVQRPQQPTLKDNQVKTSYIDVNPLQKYKQYSQEAKDLIDNEISRLKEQVQGVTIDKSNGYTRISGNAPWYREFYDANGRAPNKSEWVQLAEDSLRNDNVDGFYSSLDPKALDLNRNILDNKIYSEGKPLDVTDAQKMTELSKKELTSIENNTPPTVQDLDTPLTFEQQLNKQAKWNEVIDNTYNKVTERKLKANEKIKLKVAKQEDTEAIKFIKQSIQKNTKGAIQKEVQDTLPTVYRQSLEWKDKPRLLLTRERMDRNFEGVMGKDAPEMIKTYLEPVYKNEADRVRFLNKEKAEIKNLGIKAKSDESKLLQLYGEKKISLDQLKELTPQWQKVVKAEQVFRQKYNKYIVDINKSLQLNGYDPIPYRKDYFKHFAEIGGALEKFGISKVDNLPTDINGLTADFKPGKNFFSSALPRLGDKTEFDAITGIDKYLYGASSLMYHTSDIKRLRGLEEALRSQHAGTQHLTNFVADLSEYTNTLAGKKSMIDRASEALVGRRIYSAVDKLKQQTGANMTGANVASALTNYIPLTQSLATTDKRDFTKGMLQTLRSIVRDDGFRNQSDFLTKRDGVDPLYRSLWGNIQNKGGFLFKAVDTFVSGTITRAKYYEGMRKGMSQPQAIKYADDYASRLMGDRSLGSMPTLFNSKTLGLFTQFQLETNNQLSFIFKDIPKNYDKKGTASAIAQVFLFSYLFNNLYESAFGRRPAFDPVGVAFQTYQDYTDPEMKEGQATKNLIKNTADQIPFASTFTGGRIPIGSAIPNPLAIASGDSSVGKEASKLFYSLPPTAGGQIKKTIEGLGAFNQGASTSETGRVRYPIPQTPINLVRTAIGGQYSTPEARDYFRKGTSTLGDEQSKVLLAGNDKSGIYNQYMDDRQLNRQIDAVKAEVLSTGKYKVLNNKVYYKNKKDNSVESISMDFNVERPQLTESKLLNKKLLSQYQSDVSSKITDVTNLYKLGVIDLKTADNLINELTAQHTLANKLNKQSGGSTRKLKVPKIKAIKQSKTIKAPRLRSSKPKMFKIPQLSSYVQNNLPASQLKAIPRVVAKMPLKVDPRILKNVRA